MALISGQGVFVSRDDALQAVSTVPGIEGCSVNISTTTPSSSYLWLQSSLVLRRFSAARLQGFPQRLGQGDRRCARLPLPGSSPGCAVGEHCVLCYPEPGSPEPPRWLQSSP